MSRFFLLDKPAGRSSFAALGFLKKNIGTQKVGHAGTLDPFATGLLLVLSGKLTKAVHFLTDLEKKYEAVFRFGRETETLDTEGHVIAEAPIPTFQSILDASESFRGTIHQIPPSFSAVKINGKRSYSQARKGIQVDIPERRVFVRSFDILSWNPPDLAVNILCSKGTYVRSIARDLGLASGSRAFCQQLRRCAIGSFDVINAVHPEAVCQDDGTMPVDFFRSIGVPVRSLPAGISHRMRQGSPLHNFTDVLFDVKSRWVLCTDPCEVPVALLDLRGENPAYSIVFDSECV